MDLIPSASSELLMSEISFPFPSLGSDKMFSISIIIESIPAPIPYSTCKVHLKHPPALLGQAWHASYRIPGQIDGFPIYACPSTA